jgi:hypothetical protein
MPDNVENLDTARNHRRNHMRRQYALKREWPEGRWTIEDGLPTWVCLVVDDERCDPDWLNDHLGIAHLRRHKTTSNAAIILRRHGVRVNQLAAHMLVTPAAVSRWLAGERAAPASLHNALADLIGTRAAHDVLHAIPRDDEQQAA